MSIIHRFFLQLIPCMALLTVLVFPVVAMSPFQQPTSTTDSASASPKQQPKASPSEKKGISVSDEDILFEEGEAPLKTEVVVPALVPKPQEAATMKTEEDSIANPMTKNLEPMPDVIGDSTLRATPVKPTVSVEDEQDVTNVPAPKQLQPKLVIESSQSIDFSKNLKEYRSPRIAMLLSLILPGLGQFYAHSNGKAALYLGLEVALGTAATVLAVQGNQQEQEARDFADAHYSVDTMVNYYHALRSKILLSVGADTLSDGTPKEQYADFEMENIFYDSGLVLFRQGAIDKSDDYFGTIETKSYVQGWDDCEPDYQAIFNGAKGTPLTGNHGTYEIVGTGLEGTDSSYLVYRIKDEFGTPLEKDWLYGYSQNQHNYMNMRKDSKELLDASKYVLFAMIANHVISAIDAGITARRYNDRLLNKQSIWNHLSIHNQFALNTSDVRVGAELRLKF